MGPGRMGPAASHPHPRQVVHLLPRMALLFGLGHIQSVSSLERVCCWVADKGLKPPE